MQAHFDSWATVFNAMVLQAVPFLVLGVVLASIVAVLVPVRVWKWAFGHHVAISIPLATACGVLVPGCECTTVPIAGRLTQRGVPFPAALSFALASPALNPIVMIATAVAFAGQLEMVAARFLASFLAVVVVGSYLAATGVEPVRRAHHDHEPEGAGVVRRLINSAQHDLLHTLGLVVLGAGIAACLRAFVPASVFDHFADRPVLAVALMAALAIALALCSESDAFVAASFVMFPRTALLTFMVVGPLVDIRLLLMYRSVFGGRAAAAIGGFALLGAIATSTVVGALLL